MIAHRETLSIDERRNYELRKFFSNKRKRSIDEDEVLTMDLLVYKVLEMHIDETIYFEICYEDQRYQILQQIEDLVKLVNFNLFYKPLNFRRKFFLLRSFLLP